MLEYLGIDAFTGLTLVFFGVIVGAVMVPIQLILQVRHDQEGFGWKEPVYGSAGLSFGLGAIVVIGGAVEGTPSEFYIADGLALTAVLLPPTLVGGLFGRVIGWVIMRAQAFFNNR